MSSPSVQKKKRQSITVYDLEDQFSLADDSADAFSYAGPQTHEAYAPSRTSLGSNDNSNFRDEFATTSRVQSTMDLTKKLSKKSDNKTSRRSLRRNSRQPSDRSAEKRKVQRRTSSNTMMRHDEEYLKREKNSGGHLVGAFKVMEGSAEDISLASTMAPPSVNEHGQPMIQVPATLVDDASKKAPLPLREPRAELVLEDMEGGYRPQHDSYVRDYQSPPASYHSPTPIVEAKPIRKKNWLLISLVIVAIILLLVAVGSLTLFAIRSKQDNKPTTIVVESEGNGNSDDTANGVTDDDNNAGDPLDVVDDGNKEVDTTTYAPSSGPVAPPTTASVDQTPAPTPVSLIVGTPAPTSLTDDQTPAPTNTVGDSDTPAPTNSEKPNTSAPTNVDSALPITPSPTNTATGSGTLAPTPAPTTADPTPSPTPGPTLSPTTAAPTKENSPTMNPTKRTPSPTPSPTPPPTEPPTTLSPTKSPTSRPTSRSPTPAPIDATPSPITANPTLNPTSSPTDAPTSNAPTNPPTEEEINWSAYRWDRVGQDLTMPAASDFGSSASLSGNGMILAAASPKNGVMDVYELQSGSWSLRESIVARGTRTDFGTTVDLSFDGGRVATSNPYLSDTKPGVGRILNWRNGVYRQLGGPGAENRIHGEVLGENGEVLIAETDSNEFAYDVAITPDGSTMALGARRTCIVRMIQILAQEWVDLPPIGCYDGADFSFGWSVDVDATGTTVVVGSPEPSDFNYGGAADNITPPGRGRAYVFRLSGGKWEILGDPLIGRDVNDRFGWTVSVSDNGRVVAMGAPGADSESGSVHIYQWNDNAGNWEEMGRPIPGTSFGGHMGTSVSLSPDGETVAVGTGQFAKTFRHINGEWRQIGEVLSSPHSVSTETGVVVDLLEGRLVVGFPSQSTNSNGVVRVYDLAYEKEVRR